MSKKEISYKFILIILIESYWYLIVYLNFLQINLQLMKIFDKFICKDFNSLDIETDISMVNEFSDFFEFAI